MALTIAEEEAIIERLAVIDASEKTLDNLPNWILVLDRPSGKLYWNAAVRVNSFLGGGVSIRFTTPQEAWNSDVYGHIEVAIPSLGSRRLRLNPAEWKPKKEHHNPAWAPEPHRLTTCLDRWHPYSLNKNNGLNIFTQAAVGVAVPFPDDILTFSDYLSFCAGIWKCPDVLKVTPPPWSPQLI